MVQKLGLHPPKGRVESLSTKTKKEKKLSHICVVNNSHPDVYLDSYSDTFSVSQK